MKPAEFRRMAGDPMQFFSPAIVATPQGPVAFGSVMQPFQRERFASLIPSLQAVAAGKRPPTGRHWWECVKGASKTSDMAIALLWLLIFARRELLIQCGAADSDQADEVRKAIRTLLALNPRLEPYVEVQNWRIICRQTGSVIQIESADAPSAHGSRPAVVALDELVHVQSREFAETLFDNLTKMANGLGLIATNAGHTRSWQADWRELARTSPNWHFHQHAKPAPWLNAEDIEEARRRNSPTRFNRLFAGIWSPGGGDAIERGDILACITRQSPTYAPEDGVDYVIGLDLSTKRDRSAMSLLGADPRTKKVHVALCQSWSPIAAGMIDLISVRQTVEVTAKRFSADVIFDPFQASLLTQELTAANIRCREMTFVANNLSLMATSLMQIFRQKQIELYPDAQLIADLQKLSIEERGFNNVKLTAPSDRETGHADLAISLAIALPAAIEAASREPPSDVWYGGSIMGSPIPAYGWTSEFIPRRRDSLWYGIQQ